MPETLPDLMRMLNDSDKRVRCSALHTLACDPCKEGTSCRPEEGPVLPKAMELLASDPDAHVRALAIEVVGQFVHTNTLAVVAISSALKMTKAPRFAKRQDGMRREGRSTNGLSQSLDRRRHPEE